MGLDFWETSIKNELALLTKTATCTSHISPADLRIISCQYQALQDTKLQFKALLHHCFHLAARYQKPSTEKGGRSDQRTLKSTKSQRKDLFSSLLHFFPAIVDTLPTQKAVQQSFSNDPNASTVITWGGLNLQYLLIWSYMCFKKWTTEQKLGMLNFGHLYGSCQARNKWLLHR